MSSTIHFVFELPFSTVKYAYEIIGQLHSFTAKKTFAHCSDIIHSNHNPLIPNNIALPHRNLLAIASKLETSEAAWKREIPMELIVFSCTPTAKSESACFGLARYSDTPDPGLDEHGYFNWSWRGFCKTISPQDSTNEEIHRCIRNHTMIVMILDRAIELGVCFNVLDETEYWLHRDHVRLVSLLASRKHCQSRILDLLAADDFIMRNDG
jgi:hypothetical protein